MKTFKKFITEQKMARTSKAGVNEDHTHSYSKDPNETSEANDHIHIVGHDRCLSETIELSELKDAKGKRIPKDLEQIMKDLISAKKARNKELISALDKEIKKLAKKFKLDISSTK